MINCQLAIKPLRTAKRRPVLQPVRALHQYLVAIEFLRHALHAGLAAPVARWFSNRAEVAAEEAEVEVAAPVCKPAPR
jgi:hypothetical protein